MRRARRAGTSRRAWPSQVSRIAAAAARELTEETGLVAAEADLRPFGVHAYLRDKDLALFAWLPARAVARTLVCHSTFTLPDGTVLPEFDRFALAGWDAAYGKVGKNLARLLAIVRGSLVVLTGRPAR